MLLLLKIVAALAIFSFCMAAITERKIPTGRSVEEAPWTVIIERDNDVWLLGTIIAPNTVITVTRTINHVDPQNFIVRAGSSKIGQGGSLHNITRVLNHPFASNRGFDIGLVYVDPPFVFDNLRQSIKINRNADKEGVVDVPTYDDDGNFILRQETLIGWDYCNDWYLIIQGLDSSQGCMVSSNGIGPCYYDIGTGVIQNGSLIGVLSEAFPICDDERWPITFSNLTDPYLSMWLEANAP